VTTLVPSSTRSVRAPRAASQENEKGACPPVWRQGWKWSLTITLSKPQRSACSPNASSSRGPNCSADAL
jgi:hypothetical protein